MRAVILGAVVVLTTLVATRAGGQTADFEASVDLARVFVEVQLHGDPVYGLRPEDFAVTADGSPRPISVFMAPNETRLALALVMDFSGSMQRLGARSVAKDLLDMLDPETCVLFVPFPAGERRWARADAPSLRAAIDSIPTGGMTALFDAILAAYGLLSTRAIAGAVVEPLGTIEEVPLPQQVFGLRRSYDYVFRSASVLPDSETCQGSDAGLTRERYALAVVTDAGENSSRVSLPDLLLAAAGRGIPTWSIVVQSLSEPGSINRVGHMDGRGALRELRELGAATGARAVRTFGLERVAAQLAEQLRAFYVLGFATEPSPTEDTRIRVEVADPYRVTYQPPGKSTGLSREASASAAVLQGMSHLSNGEATEALRLFEAAVDEDPELGAAHYGHGLALASMGRPSAAIEAYLLAERWAPWTEGLQMRLVNLLMEQGDSRAAMAHLLRAGQGGVDIREQVVALQARGIDTRRLAGALGVPRIYIARPTVASLDAQLVIQNLLAAIGVALLEHPDVGLATSPGLADAAVLLEVRGVSSGDPREVEALVELRDRQGGLVGSALVDVPDISRDADVQSIAAIAVDEIAAALATSRR